jgi:hypothetical protein
MLEIIKSRFTPTAFTQPPYFTLVVETEGLNQAIFKSEIRHFVQRSPLPESQLGQADSTRAQ